MLVETNIVCDKMLTSYGKDSLKNCLLLMWAQRDRLPQEEKTKRGAQALGLLARLEREKKLSVRDKFVDLFILEQIEQQNPPLLKSVKRKIKRTKEIYQSEMIKLLPGQQSKLRVGINKKRQLKIERFD